MTNDFNSARIRQDFPCLHQEINGNPLIFLDSAASAQKPQIVIDALKQVYEKEYANIHRGIYALSEIATRKFEETRQKIAQFLNATSAKEIVFTRGATEAINLVAHSYGKAFIRKGDEIIISQLEHHANIVPWQQLCLQTGAKLRIVPINDQGELDVSAYQALLSKKTKLVAITHLSNALGTITPIEQIISLAHAVGAHVLVDASQSAVHNALDVQALDCDFLVFSGHKLYGPNGTGVLYGKYNLLEQLPPYQTGGEMIEQVHEQTSTFREPPLRFEAGTPVIAEIIALGTAIDYLNRIDRKAARTHEDHLLAIATREIQNLKGFRLVGTAAHKASIISFIHETAHPNDIGSILDRCSVAIRTGHHCAQPLMTRLGLTATARVSLAMYNTEADIDGLLKALHTVNRLFSGVS